MKHSMVIEDLRKDYLKWKCAVISAGYKSEIDTVKNRHFNNQTSHHFKIQYIYTVLNAGIKNQVAENIFEKYLENGIEAINHEGKRKAIEELQNNYKEWFRKLKSKNTIEEKLDYLESLSWIGKVTKYHLARNLGIDVAKPDRHLKRVSKKYGFDDVQEFCEEISNMTGDRVGVVDVVVWRYCNLGLISYDRQEVKE